MKDVKNLMDNENYFKHVIELSFDPFIVMDSDGKIVVWNEAAVKSFGWTKEDAIGKVMASFFLKKIYHEPHNNMLKAFLNAPPEKINDVIETTKIFFEGMALEVLCKDGTDAIIKASVMPYMNDGSWIFPAFIRRTNEIVKPNTDLDRIIPRLQLLEPMMDDVGSLIKKLKDMQISIEKEVALQKFTEDVNGISTKLQNVESNLVKLLRMDISFENM
jgi:PAS domain S-box-containing protein